MSEVLSPMAGMVFSIPVKIGDAVKAGDEIIVLESMKMEIPVFAEDEGVVAAIHVAKGTPVDAGSKLFTLG